MTNGTITLQKVMKKIDNLEERLKKVEKNHSVREIKISEKEMAELEEAKKEIRAGHYLSEKELFRILSE